MSCRFLSIFIFAGVTAVANANIAYQYIDIEASFGAPVTSITDISESGFILVNGTILYDLVKKRKTPIPGLGGLYKTYGASVNAFNFVVGTASEYPLASGAKAVLWKPSQPSTLIALNSFANAPRSFAFSINNLQEIVGVTSTGP